ncbi:MAG: protein kinase [Anaerolineae bacterium]|nr:protein kinase [Anaerolineae bacterium]
MSDLVGQTIHQYQIVDRLGGGGMAYVYKAYHPGLDVYRAIKIIRPEFANQPGFKERFQREAQAVARLRHPNIVQMHDYGQQDNFYYMVMEFIEGHDLKDLLQQHGAIRPFDRVAELIEPIAAALHYAHQQGVLHRDIKPANIMITPRQEAILTDFGIAKILQQDSQAGQQTEAGVSIGTPAYMAPEQARGLPNIGPTADIYSLGIVLYEMLTGQVPYQADTPLAVILKVINDPLPPPRSFSPDIPDVLQGVVLKATAKDPASRYPTATALADGLKRSLADPAAVNTASDIPLPTVETPPPSPVAATPKKRGWLIGGVVGALLLGCLVLAAIGAGVYYFTRPAPSLATWQFIVDASGNMAEPLDGRPKIDIARAALDKELRILPDNVNAGLRIFGGGESGLEPCQDTKLLVEPVTDDSGQISAALAGLSPQGEAPLTEAIVQAISDFDLSHSNKNSLIIITAGLDTCETEAISQVETLSRRLGIDLDLHLIGLGVADPAASEQLQQLATAAGGDYYAADSEDEVRQVLGDQIAIVQGTPVAAQSTAPTAPAEAASSPPSGEGVPLGQLVTGAAAAGSTSTHLIDGHAGQVIFIDFQKAESVYTNYTLIAPDGITTVYENSTSAPLNSDPITLDQDGTYTLSITPPEDAGQTYGFVVWNVDPPVIDGGPITIGQLTSGQTKIPGQMVEYNLAGQAGQVIFIDFQKAESVYTNYKLIAPDGITTVYENSTSAPLNSDPVTLEQAGTYVLWVDPNEDGLQKFDFVVWNVDPPVIDGGPITIGQLTSGQTKIPGQTVEYNLAGQAGQVIFIDFQNAESVYTHYKLIAPDGITTVYESSTSAPLNSDPVTLEQAGAYLLQVDPNDDGLQKFDFVVWNVDPLVIDGGEVALGSSVSGKIATPGQIAQYAFAGTAGQTISLNFEFIEGGYTNFKILAPDGFSELYNQSTSGSWQAESIALEQDGNYTLMVDPNEDVTVTFTFVIKIEN